MYGYNGKGIVVPEDMPMEGIMDIINSGMETVNAIASNVSENKDTYMNIFKMVSGSKEEEEKKRRTPSISTGTSFPGLPSPGPTNQTNQANQSQPAEKSFFTTPAGIAVIAGGGLVLLLGAYLVIKK